MYRNRRPPSFLSLFPPSFALHLQYDSSFQCHCPPPLPPIFLVKSSLPRFLQRDCFSIVYFGYVIWWIMTTARFLGDRSVCNSRSIYQSDHQPNYASLQLLYPGIRGTSALCCAWTVMTPGEGPWSGYARAQLPRDWTLYLNQGFPFRWRLFRGSRGAKIPRTFCRFGEKEKAVSLPPDDKSRR